MMAATSEAPVVPEAPSKDETIQELQKLEKRLRNDGEGGGKAFPVPRLDDMCVEVIAEHFPENPCLDEIPVQYVEEVVAKLDIPAVQVNLNRMTHAVSSEKFWEKMCLERWQNCQIELHGSSWKRCYLERHLAETLEEYYPSKDDDTCLNALMEVVKAVAPYVHTVRVRQLLSHCDLSLILARVPNLTTLDITYGADNVQMNYDKSTFGMKLTDALSLGKMLQNTRTINYLALAECLIDDEKMHLLMSGLQANDTIATLELHHNLIGDVGAQRMALWLQQGTVLMTLNLCDNQIGPQGVRYLAEAMRANKSVRSLNLRLNKLGDEGVKMLLHELRGNTTLRKLNICSNGMGPEAVETIIDYIAAAKQLTHFDISCNKCIRGDRDEDTFQSLHKALSENGSIESFDARHTGLTGLQLKQLHQVVFPRAIATKRGHRHGFLNPEWELEYGEATM